MLDAEGIELSVWRIHSKIGMSGGLFTNQLLRETGMEISQERVERLQQSHAEAYRRRAQAVRPLPGARELLSWLTDARIPWAIATSGRMETASVNLRSLGVDPESTPVVTCDMVRYAKPDPDLFIAAAEGVYPHSSGGSGSLQPLGGMATLAELQKGAVPRALAVSPFWRAAKYPPCPKCGWTMWLAHIEPDKPDHDKRTFECPKCADKSVAIVKYR